MRLSMNTLPNIQDSDLRTEKGIKELKDYLYQLTEQLHFVLNHIDLDNLSGDLEQMTSNMQSQLVKLNNKIGLLVTESDGSNTISAASIIAAINGGKSAVLISADKVQLLPGEELISIINGAGGGTKLNQSVLDLSEYIKETDAHQVAQEEIRNDTSILQQAERIITTALSEYTRTNDFELLRSTIQSQFEQLADGFEFKISQTVQQTSELASETQSRFDTIESFVRIVADGLVVGKSTSDISLQLKNDILYFKEGDDVLAYFSAGKLHIGEAQIEVLSIGTDDSMMRFKIVGEGDNECLLISPISD